MPAHLHIVPHRPHSLRGQLRARSRHTRALTARKLPGIQQSALKENTPHVN